LSHIPSPFIFSLFFSYGLRIALPGQAWNLEPPASSSQVDGTIGVHHHTWLVLIIVLYHYGIHE
jgi:hypothetical protein